MLIDGNPGRTVPALDRGLHYGDGLFETIAVQAGRPLLLERHLRRLQSGCARLDIPCPDLQLLAGETGQVALGSERAVVKIIVTRGSGGRGYAPPGEPRPLRIVSLHEWPEYPAVARTTGVDVALCRIRLARQPALAGLKHLNRLEQVLARGEVLAAGALEGVVLDTSGFAIEGTMSNLFAIRGDDLWTPDLSACGVEGVVRTEILDRAAAWSLRTVVRECTPEDIATADEAFLTNSIIGVWPLRAIAGRTLRGTARATEIARRLVAEGAIPPP